MIKEQKKLLYKWKGFAKIFYDTSQMIKNITSKDHLKKEYNIDKLDNNQVIEYSKNLWG